MTKKSSHHTIVFEVSRFSKAHANFGQGGRMTFPNKRAAWTIFNMLVDQAGHLPCHILLKNGDFLIEEIKKT